MADTRENIILQVGLDGGKVSKDLADISRQIANVKKEQKQLDAEYKAGKVSLAEYTASTAAMKDELTWLQKQQKGVIATTKLLTETNDTYGDSLNDERQKLADMQKAYDQLDKSMRESEGGKKFLEAIKAQSDVVKGLEEDTGRFQRNVGNYGSAFEGVADKAKLLNDAFKATSAGSSALGKGIDTLDKSAKVMSKNPLFGVFVLLAPLLSKIAGLIGQNTALMDALNKVLKPVGDALKWIADIITNVLLAAVNALIAAWEKLKSLFSWFTGGGGSTEYTEEQLEAARATKEHANRMKELNEGIAKQSKELKKLSSEYDYYLKKMKAAGASQKDIQKQSLEFDKELLDKRKELRDASKKMLDEQEKYAKKVGTIGSISAEAQRKYLLERYQKFNDEYVEAERDFELKKLEYQTEANNEELEREQAHLDALNKQREQMRMRDLADIEKTFDALEKAEKKELETIGLTEQEKQSIRDYYARQRAQAQEEWLNKAVERAEKEKSELVKKEAELIQASQDLLEQLDESEDEELIPTPDEMAARIFGLNAEGVEYFKELLDDGINFTNAGMVAIAKQAEQSANRTAQVFSEIGNGALKMGDALNDLTKAFGDNSEEAARIQKATALGSILINQAMAIAEGAKGISAAMAGAAAAAAATGPAAPLMLPIYQAQMVGQILAVIATTASSIAQAKQILSQADAGNFSDGGTIEGTSYTGDKLIAHVNSGEGIYTNKQANNLLQEIANNPLRGGADMDAMTAAFTAAVAALPAPKMVYSEFNDFTQEVATYNELAAI